MTTVNNFTEQLEDNEATLKKITAFELTGIKSLLANLLNTALLQIEEDNNKPFLLAKAALRYYVQALPDGELIQDIQDLLEKPRPVATQENADYAITINRIIRNIRRNIDILLPELDFNE